MAHARCTLLRLVAGALLLTVSADSARAQDLVFQLGRLLSNQERTTYRLGLVQPIAGVAGWHVYGAGLRSPERSDAPLVGLGADLSLFQDGDPGIYLIGGVAGGVGLESAETLWGSWSAGLGIETFPADFLVLGLEGRWHELSAGDQRGIELALRLGARFGGSPGGPSHGPIDRPAPAGLPTRPGEPIVVDRAADGRSDDARELIEQVLATAKEAVGTPYRFGGEDEDEGFDCSGLIQYAYGAHGVTLPRRSVDQARQGRAVEKSLDQLAAGDILAFSNRGGPVTHVGLYLGNGRFIHSASRGVQISRLSPDDPYGSWWWKRWVGARRIVE